MCKIYNPGENEVRALDHVNLTIHKNEFVAIIGQSGSGKSTLMNMLGCLDVPTSGTYLLNGKDVSHMTDDELSDTATSQFLDGMEKRLKRQLELIDELRRETPLTPSQPEEPERVHRFTPPVEPQTPVLTPKEQPKEPSHNRAYDYEAEQSHPSAEEKADALIEEIGQQIEQSLSGSTLGDIAQEDHSGDTRKLDTLHGFPVSKKFEDLQFGRNYDPKKR